MGTEDEDYYDEDDEDIPIAPGPGHYYTAQHATTFNIKNVPVSMQYFGSSVQRFAEANTKESNQAIGPGSYSVQVQNQKRMRNTAAPFTSTNSRF